MKKLLIILFAMYAQFSFSQNKTKNAPIKELPAYNFLSRFWNGHAYVQKKLNDSTFTFGFIDKTGKEIVPCTQKMKYAYDDRYNGDFFGSPYYYFINKQGLTVLKKNDDKEYVFDVRNNVFFAEGYQHVTMTGNNFIAHKNDSTLCLLNENGKLMFQLSTKRDIYIINKNRYMYQVGNKTCIWRIIDANNNLIKEIPYENFVDMKVLSETRLGVRPLGTWGLLDQDGNEIVAPKYDDIKPFQEGYANVRIFSNSRTNEAEKKGLIDENGAPFIIKNEAIRLTDYSFFSEGSMLVEVNTGGRHAATLMDTKGNLILKPVFNLIYPFSDGIAPIDLDRAVGCIDKTGKLLFRTKNIVSFSDGLAVDYLQTLVNDVYFKNYEIIDKQGKIIMQTTPVKRDE
jgi:hypothetical protein